MRKRRMLCLLFALALALSLLAGCGAAPETAQSQGGDTAADDGHYPVTVTNYDREVTVESKPESVLTLGPNCTELFVALGLGDLVVGRSLVNHSRGPLDEYADEVNAIPELNHSSATRERILSSGADFIYTLDWEIGEEGVVIDEVEEYGMNVYVNANVEDAAAKFIQEQKDRISAVQDKVKGEEPVKVLIYDSGNDGVFTCSGTNFETLLVELAGGKNIFDDITERDWVTVSYEEVLAREPDIILIHDYDSPSVEEKIKEITSNPVLSQLDCVKNQRFATIQLESVLPGDRMAYSVERMAADFFPDLFK